MVLKDVVQYDRSHTNKRPGATTLFCITEETGETFAGETRLTAEATDAARFCIC